MRTFRFFFARGQCSAVPYSIVLHILLFRRSWGRMIQVAGVADFQAGTDIALPAGETAQSIDSQLQPSFVVSFSGRIASSVFKDA